MSARDVVTALRPDGRRSAIHPIDVHGRFIRWRRIVFALLVGIYVLAPLVHIGGRPGLFLDVEARRFFLFGGTFNAQDISIVLFFVVAVVFVLLFVTAWHGRLWCGWACPQTVFLEGVFRPIERIFEGPRSRRMKLSDSPWTLTRALRTGGKHMAYAIVALILAHSALVPFVSAAAFAAMLKDGPGAHPLAFGWAMAITSAAYLNFAWFREQLCVVLCPYGRLQSVLHDRDSIIIGYDARRGEPRGPLRRSAKLVAVAQTAGDCVDCRKCVHVCPTAIDIRDGLQMECIACAQCIDVCDDVMDKVGRPRGLIRLASLNELAGQPRRTWRPRLLLYGSIATLSLVAFGASLYGRTPFEANVMRPPGVPWVMDGTTVRNTFDVHLVNKSASSSRIDVRIEANVPVESRLGATSVSLASLEHVHVPLVVVIDRRFAGPNVQLTLVLREDRTGVERRRDVPFAAPPR